jgi:hypothetical protein
MVVGIVYKAKYHTITTTTSPFDVQFACEKMYSALTIKTFPKSNRKIVERDKIDTPITPLYWYRHLNKKWWG